MTSKIDHDNEDAIRADERAKVLEEVHNRTMTRAILPDLTPDEEASDDLLPEF